MFDLMFTLMCIIRRPLLAPNMASYILLFRYTGSTGSQSQQQLRTVRQNMNELSICITQRNKPSSISFVFNEHLFKLNVLFKYNDTGVQLHERGWIVSFSQQKKSCLIRTLGIVLHC